MVNQCFSRQNNNVHYAGYVGTGTDTRNIVCGFKPSAVILMQSGRYLMVGDTIICGGMFDDGSPIRNSKGEICAKINYSGFTVYDNVQNSQLNTNKVGYDFIAFK